MSFRLILISALSVLIVECSKPGAFLGRVQLNMGDTSCFNGAGQRIQAFTEGTPQAADIHGIWTCSEQIVDAFTDITVGSSPDRYSIQDLRTFLTRHYFPNGITDAAAMRTMEVKQFLVGGDAQFITRNEIQLILNDVSQLDVISGGLAPSTPIIFGGDNATSSEPQWTSAYKKMASSLDQIGVIFAKSSMNYAFTDLQALIVAWCDELQLPSDHQARKIASLLPAVGKVKSILIGGSPNFMTPAEWRPFFADVVKAYMEYRQVGRIFNKGSGDRLTGLASPKLMSAVSSIVDFISATVAAQPGGQISYTDIQAVVNSLYSAGYLPDQVTVDGVMKAAQVTVEKILAVPGTNPSGLDVVHVAEGKKFLARWEILETALETGNHAAPELDHALRPSPENPTWVLRLDSSGHLQIPSAGGNRLNREFSLLFAAVEWLGDKWAKWPLSAADFHSVVKDALIAAHGLNLLTTTKDTIFKKLFLEANLFTPSGNGDQNLDLSEAFQYGLFALSSYHGSAEWKSAAASSCQPTDYECQRSFLFQNRRRLLGSFALLNVWLNSRPDAWSAFSQNIVGIVGQDQLLEQFMVMHYLETFVQRYDVSPRDGLIELNEAMMAYPIFEPTLTSFLVPFGYRPEQILPFFTFLFKYGTTYDKLPIGGAIIWEHWQHFHQNWSSISADRNILTGILAQLAAMENLPSTSR